jgi:hypothetical protein
MIIVVRSILRFMSGISRACHIILATSARMLQASFKCDWTSDEAPAQIWKNTAKTLQCHGFWGLASRIPRQLFHTTGNSFATHRYSKMIGLNPTFFNTGKYLFLLVNLSKTNALMIKWVSTLVKVLNLSTALRKPCVTGQSLTTLSTASHSAIVSVARQFAYTKTVILQYDVMHIQPKIVPKWRY